MLVTTCYLKFSAHKPLGYVFFLLLLIVSTDPAILLKDCITVKGSAVLSTVPIPLKTFTTLSFPNAMVIL